MAQQDCYFYYYSNCAKGAACPFRHQPLALGTEQVCPAWMKGTCCNNLCSLRHMTIQKHRSQEPCYWESQPGGCQKAHCVFLHRNQREKPASIVPSVDTTALLSIPALSSENKASLPVSNKLSLGVKSVSCPVIEQLVINPRDGESDQDSVSGSPVKSLTRCTTQGSAHSLESLVGNTTAVLPASPATVQPLSPELDSDTEVSQGSEPVKTETKVKDTESKQKKITADTLDTDTVMESSQSSDELTTSVDRRDKSSPSCDDQSLGIKSLEQIKREKALASLKRNLEKRDKKTVDAERLERPISSVDQDDTGVVSEHASSRTVIIAHDSPRKVKYKETTPEHKASLKATKHKDELQISEHRTKRQSPESESKSEIPERKSKVRSPERKAEQRAGERRNIKQRLGLSANDENDHRSGRQSEKGLGQVRSAKDRLGLVPRNVTLQDSSEGRKREDRQRSSRLDVRRRSPRSKSSDQRDRRKSSQTGHASSTSPANTHRSSSKLSEKRSHVSPRQGEVEPRESTSLRSTSGSTLTSDSATELVVDKPMIDESALGFKRGGVGTRKVTRRIFVVETPSDTKLTDRSASSSPVTVESELVVNSLDDKEIDQKVSVTLNTDSDSLGRDKNTNNRRVPIRQLYRPPALTKRGNEHRRPVLDVDVRDKIQVERSEKKATETDWLNVRSYSEIMAEKRKKILQKTESSSTLPQSTSPVLERDTGPSINNISAKLFVDVTKEARPRHTFTPIVFDSCSSTNRTLSNSRRNNETKLTGLKRTLTAESARDFTSKLLKRNTSANEFTMQQTSVKNETTKLTDPSNLLKSKSAVISANKLAEKNLTSSRTQSQQPENLAKSTVSSDVSLTTSDATRLTAEVCPDTQTLLHGARRQSVDRSGSTESAVRQSGNRPNRKISDDLDLFAEQFDSFDDDIVSFSTDIDIANSAINTLDDTDDFVQEMKELLS